jgi:hypothetical protein
MSFTKCPGDEQSKDEKVEQDQPRFCIIQIGFSKLYLSGKWLPLMMLIQLIQATALEASISASQALKKKTSTNMLRLMWFFHFLLEKFAQDAMDELMVSRERTLPHDWMPELMHRCLTRIELDIPHSPEALEKNSLKLNGAYKNRSSHFAYGLSPVFSIHITFILTLSVDYCAFTQAHQLQLIAALKFLGTPDPSMSLKMLQHEFTVYRLDSAVEAEIIKPQLGKFQHHHHVQHKHHVS